MVFTKAQLGRDGMNYQVRIGCRSQFNEMDLVEICVRGCRYNLQRKARFTDAPGPVSVSIRDVSIK